MCLLNFGASFAQASITRYSQKKSILAFLAGALAFEATTCSILDMLIYLAKIVNSVDDLRQTIKPNPVWYLFLNIYTNIHTI